jgi:isoamylase
MVSRSNDLVSYNEKHNEANGEDGNDGIVRQPLVELRCRRARPTSPAAQPACHRKAMLLAVNASSATMLATRSLTELSQGTPMLLAGDEFGRTQNTRFVSATTTRILPGRRQLLPADA